jgi:hypothetical protein
VSIVVDVQTVSIAIASTGVLIAAIYYIFQIRHQTKIRKTELVIRLYNTYSSKEFNDAWCDFMGLQFEDYNEFREKYGSRFSKDMREIGKSVSIVIGFFELVGVLLYRKHIDLVMVNDIFSPLEVKELYERMKPVILGGRKTHNQPIEFGGLEYLYNELLSKQSQLNKTWAKAHLQTVSDSTCLTSPLGDQNG